ncbi:MAG TPA: SRPBCC domain-containing protein [Rhodocyclaceae bacterium]|nr:SRPBCC domain-containing protein [Rhodocyclaceae bacterium]
MTRTFDAPRKLVWQAWTQREHLWHWWATKNVTLRVLDVDFREGGALHCCVRIPDGSEIWSRWIYREIHVPERIVFVNSFSDEAGKVVRRPNAPDWPLEMLTAFAFSEHAGKTTLTMRATALNATERERKAFIAGHAGMLQGWTETLDRLAAYLVSPSKQA